MNIYDCNNYDDYFQIGVIGLINASKQYNKNIKITFLTYAYICIRNEILKYIKTNQNLDVSIKKEIYDDLTIENKLYLNVIIKVTMDLKFGVFLL